MNLKIAEQSGKDCAKIERSIPVSEAKVSAINIPIFPLEAVS